MILHIQYACPPRTKSHFNAAGPLSTASTPTFPYSLTLRPAAAPTRSDPPPLQHVPPPQHLSPPSTACPPPQRLPPYSLTFWIATAQTRSDSHPAAAVTFFLMNLLNKRHKCLHATALALKKRGMWGEAVRGNLRRWCGTSCAGDMRILYVKSYRRGGLAASGDKSIFLDWWDPLYPLK